MSILFEYKPGMSLTDPWVITTARAQSAYQVTKTGTLQQVGANVLRDAHYIGGVRTTLGETASVNSCLQSQALATSPWASGLLFTITNNAGVAPDGTTTATKAVPDATNGPNHYVNQLIAITANENIACSVFVKASGYTGLRIWCGETLADTNAFAGAFDLTGNGQSIGQKNGTGTPTVPGTFIVPLGNGWYWCGVWGAINNSATTSQIQFFVFPDYTKAVNSTSYVGDTVSGVFLWGAQHERWGTTVKGVPTSYMPTTVGTAARGRDAVTTPWPYQTMPLWIYIKSFEAGWSLPIQYTPGVLLGNSGAQTPNAGVYAWGTAQGYYMQWAPGTGPGGSNATAAVQTATPLYGQSVELFGRLFRDGKASTEMTAAIAGGAAVTTAAAAVGGTPIADFSSPTMLHLHLDGTFAIQSLKIGADPARITTLALARAA